MARTGFVSVLVLEDMFVVFGRNAKKMLRKAKDDRDAKRSGSVGDLWLH